MSFHSKGLILEISFGTSYGVDISLSLKRTRQSINESVKIKLKEDATRTFKHAFTRMKPVDMSERCPAHAWRFLSARSTCLIGLRPMLWQGAGKSDKPEKVG